MTRKGLVLVLAAALLASVGAQARTFTVYIAAWRGCEDACRGFQDYIRERNIDARIVVRDAEQQPERLAGFVADARAQKADVVLSWGTTVTLALVGRLGDIQPAKHLTDIPVVFMIVADPVGAGIVHGAEVSGRRNVTGTRNRVPESVQLKAISAYRPLKRLGLIYNTDEVNAVVKARELREVVAAQGVELVELRIEAAAGSAPSPQSIDDIVGQAAKAKIDFLYVASSSFLMSNRHRLTKAALEAGVPLASAYEAMVIESDALLTVAARYYNVGRLAGYQAEQILLHNADPASMPIRELDRFSYIVNMASARRLKLYPPLSVLRYAEIIDKARSPQDPKRAESAEAGLRRR